MDPPYEISWTRDKLVKVLKFIRLLRVEPYVFLFALQIGLKSAPNSQLIEDKICMQWYKTTPEYCYNLPSIKEDADGYSDSGSLGYKSRILADSAMFGTYNTYMTTGPTIIWALFAGSWIDRYVRGRKILMIMGISASIIENILYIYFSIQWKTNVYYNLTILLPSMILGQASARVAMNHYMTSTTPPKLIAMRFMLFELIFIIASPIGQALGGFMLVQKPTLHTGEIRNFTVCYIIALVLDVLAFLWIIVIVKEKVARKHEMKIEMKIQGIGGKPRRDTNIKLRSDMSREDKNIHPIRLLFDLENVKSMLRTAIKKRPNKARMQIYFIFTSMFVFVMHISGNGVVGNQFIQEVYLWKPDWSSYMNSLQLIVHAIATITIVPFLIKVVKISDVNLSIFGFIMLFAMDIIKGSWLTPLAFYIAIPAGSCAGMATVGVKSHLTKIVGRDEIGKVVSFMAALDTLAPIISNTILVVIFKYTIDTYPGSVYQVISLLILIPILMLIWIDLFTEIPLVNQDKGYKTSRYNKNQNDINDKQKQRDPRHRRHYHIENRKGEQTNDDLSFNKIDNEIRDLKLGQINFKDNI